MLTVLGTQNIQHNVKIVEELTAIANRKGISPAQLSLAWVRYLGQLFTLPAIRDSSADQGAWRRFSCHSHPWFLSQVKGFGKPRLCKRQLGPG